MQSLRSILALVLTCAGIAGCGRCMPNSPSSRVESFFRLPPTDQVRQFGSYSIDEQYELYEFGNRVVHPPATYLARPFAEQGPHVVPFLVEKLRRTNDGAEVRDIALVFSEANAGGLHDFTSEAEPLQILEKKATSIGGMWESTTFGMVMEIRGSRSK